MAVHTRNKYFCILLPSSAQKQLEMAKFCKTTAVNFSYFHLEMNADTTYLAWASSEINRHTKQISVENYKIQR